MADYRMNGNELRYRSNRRIAIVKANAIFDPSHRKGLGQGGDLILSNWPEIACFSTVST